MGLEPITVKVNQDGKHRGLIENVHYIRIQTTGVNVMLDVEPITLVIADNHKIRTEPYASGKSGVVLSVS